MFLDTSKHLNTFLEVLWLSFTKFKVFSSAFFTKYGWSHSRLPTFWFWQGLGIRSFYLVTVLKRAICSHRYFYKSDYSKMSNSLILLFRTQERYTLSKRRLCSFWRENWKLDLNIYFTLLAKIKREQIALFKKVTRERSCRSF